MCAYLPRLSPFLPTHTLFCFESSKLAFCAPISPSEHRMKPSCIFLFDPYGVVAVFFVKRLPIQIQTRAADLTLTRTRTQRLHVAMDSESD